MKYNNMLILPFNAVFYIMENPIEVFQCKS